MLFLVELFQNCISNLLLLTKHYLDEVRFVESHKLLGYSLIWSFEIISFTVLISEAATGGVL